MTDKVQKIRAFLVGIADADGVSTILAKAIEKKILPYIDSLQKEPVSVWHNASEEPNDMSHCLIFYGCKESVGHYLHYEPVLYNKKEKVFVTSSFPHPTGYKVEQKSIDGGCVAEVYKNRINRISISDITQWCYLCDLHNLSNVQRIVKDGKEPVSEDLEEAASMFARKDSCGIENPANFYYTVADKARIFKAGAKWQKEKDSLPISDNLEKFAKEIAKYERSDDTEVSYDINKYEGVIAGAQWQKVQDKQWLADNHKQIFNNGYEEGFEHGRDDAYNEIMKDAIDGEIFDIFYPDGDRLEISARIPEDKYESGDKVKLIIIKED